MEFRRLVVAAPTSGSCQRRRGRGSKCGVFGGRKFGNTPARCLQYLSVLSSDSFSRNRLIQVVNFKYGFLSDAENNSLLLLVSPSLLESFVARFGTCYPILGRCDFGFQNPWTL